VSENGSLILSLQEIGAFPEPSEPSPAMILSIWTPSLIKT